MSFGFAPLSMLKLGSGAFALLVLTHSEFVTELYFLCSLQSSVDKQNLFSLVVVLLDQEHLSLKKL